MPELWAVLCDEVVGIVVVLEITAPLEFVTVVVTAPSAAVVVVVVSPEDEVVLVEVVPPVEADTPADDNAATAEERLEPVGAAPEPADVVPELAGEVIEAIALATALIPPIDID